MKHTYPLNPKTITVPDGFNGETVQCLLTPIEEDEVMVKLPVEGSSYLFKWVYKDRLPVPLKTKEVNQ